MAAPWDPYDALPPVPSFLLTSFELRDGDELDVRQSAAHDISPSLAWSGFPAETKSFAVTCFDPDAPTASGWWHWFVYDIPATVHSLPVGAGDEAGAGLPEGAKHLVIDSGSRGYRGAWPPVGHGVHRYFFAVHALGVAQLPISPDSTPGAAGGAVTWNTLARAIIVGTYRRDN